MGRPTYGALFAIILAFGTFGCAGEDGVQGPIGPAGVDGEDGIDGEDGQDGTDGTDGHDGTDGQDGTDGTDGQDGDPGGGDVPSNGEFHLCKVSGAPEWESACSMEGPSFVSKANNIRMGGDVHDCEYMPDEANMDSHGLWAAVCNGEDCGDMAVRVGHLNGGWVKGAYVSDQVTEGIVFPSYGDGPWGYVKIKVMGDSNVVMIVCGNGGSVVAEEVYPD